MIVKVHPTGEIQSLDDLKDHVVEATKGMVKSWCMSKISPKRFKISPGIINSRALKTLKREGRDEAYVDKAFILVGDDVYVQSDSISGTHPYEHTGYIEPECCTTFPLPWYDKEPGLDIILNPPTRKSPVKSENSFDAHFKMLTGKTITISVNSGDTMLEVKLKLQEKEGIHPDQTRIIYAGQSLENHLTLSDYNFFEETTFHVVLFLCGGMYHPAASRADLEKLASEGKLESILVNIKYGPLANEKFEIYLAAGEPRESFLEQIQKKVSAIKDLQRRIDAIKRGADTPAQTAVKKKPKQDSYGMNMIPDDDTVRRMLERENELRVSEEVQLRFEEAERSGSTTDWIEVATEVQKEVLREFNVAQEALHAYRCAANKHQVSLYVKYNRARQGDLKVGSQAPDVPVGSIENGGSSLQSLLGAQHMDRPLVIIAGSLS